MNCLENKYKRWYLSIIKTAKLNNIKSSEYYTETHHIIPVSLGGSNDESNLVILTAKQHFICHLLLTKMFKLGSFEYYKMLHAFCMMDWKAGNSRMVRYTSRIYKKQRQEFSEYMSMKQTGSGNNQYGTMWVYNEKLKECMKLSKSEDIPIGWSRGRVLNWDAYFKRKLKLKDKEPINRKCKGCNKPLSSTNTRSMFCGSKCSNSYRFNHAKLVTLYRGNETKEVKRQNVPAYTKIGWKMVIGEGIEPTVVLPPVL